MSNIECGTDIIEIERIKKSLEEFKDKFKDKIYTKKEQEYCEERNKSKYQHYAGKFAAKEAIYKAISCRVGKIEWTDIEIVNGSNGKPEVIIYQNIEDLEEIKISISHCKEYAVATAIATYKE